MKKSFKEDSLVTLKSRSTLYKLKAQEHYKFIGKTFHFISEKKGVAIVRNGAGAKFKFPVKILKEMKDKKSVPTKTIKHDTNQVLKSKKLEITIEQAYVWSKSDNQTLKELANKLFTKKELDTFSQINLNWGKYCAIKKNVNAYQFDYKSKLIKINNLDYDIVADKMTISSLANAVKVKTHNQLISIASFIRGEVDMSKFVGTKYTIFYNTTLKRINIFENADLLSEFSFPTKEQAISFAKNNNKLLLDYFKGTEDGI